MVSTRAIGKRNMGRVISLQEPTSTERDVQILLDADFAQKTNPSRAAELYYTIGVRFQGRGDVETAKSYFERARKIHPQFYR